MPLTREFPHFLELLRIIVERQQGLNSQSGLTALLCVYLPEYYEPRSIKIRLEHKKNFKKLGNANKKDSMVLIKF